MNNLPSKNLIITQIVLIFVLPVALLYFDILSEGWRIVLLAICSLLIYGIIRHENWTHEDLGLRDDNIMKSLPYYLFFTIIGSVLLLFIANRAGIYAIDTPGFFIRTLALFLPISFFQEFAFRSFLIPRLKSVFNNSFLVIFSNAVLFSIIHIIYPSINIGLPITFVGGIFFAWLYLKYPNFLLVSLAHSALNITAVLLGFFNIS
jgi:membrane protease YdiL (CAAX protease family)